MTRQTLVADIGGTNSRLALAVDGQPDAVRRFENREFEDFAALLETYLASSAAAPAPARLILAVAAPVADSRAPVRLTNLDWTLDPDALAARFGVDEVMLVNDFVAAARGAARHDCALEVVGPVRPSSTAAPRVVLGPGTGFGSAYVLPDDTVVASEAGHMLLAGVTDEECEILARLRAELGPVTVEHVLSGVGLERLYRAAGGTVEASAAHWLETSSRTPAAEHALALFFAFLGIAARDLVLAAGARGGVLIAGGIVPRYASELSASVFRQRFETPSPLGDYLEQVPSWLVTDPDPALHGLAALAAT